jgi:hydrogenase expression/formation protein HypC
MCLGVPGKILDRDDASVAMPFGLVEFAGLRRRICLACVPEAQLGDFVIVHAGIAISRIDQQEAERVLEDLRTIGDLDGWEARQEP